MNYSYNFDKDLKFGKQFEDAVEDVFTCRCKVEVKAERGIWQTSGNVFFERKSRGNASGIDTTEADCWVTVFTDDEGISGMAAFPVKRLKARLNELSRRGLIQIKDGGDLNSSKGWLISKEHIPFLLGFKLD